MERFTIKDFNAQYPDDTACLKAIFKNRYGALRICLGCDKRTTFYRVKERKCYACQYCGYQLHSLADTIFHKSDTPLKSWFYAIYLFANSKNGVSAKELERQLGVTYKTAWRMAKQIRVLFHTPARKLSHTVEMDDTYIGGVQPGKRGRGAAGKSIVLGAVQRDGRLAASVVSNLSADTVRPFIEKHIQPGAALMTDEFTTYRRTRKGYTHRTINHSSGKYVRGKVHTNTIEGFWSQLKRSISGTYHAVSPKYLQQYVNEFAYRYSKREWPTSLFFPMLARAGRPA
ncbi:MAG: IS1595 family transposase [Candidatus Omnitrophota bacterium]|nr:IS1595 family transposase [Candidatus Omnitrophota bacterium]